MAHPCNGILSCKTKKQIADISHNINKPQRYDAKLKKTKANNYILCDGMYMKFQKRQIYRVRMQISGYLRQELGMEGNL